MSSINVTTCIQPIRNTLTHSSTQLAVWINVYKCVCYELFHFVHCLGLSLINLIFQYAPKKEVHWGKVGWTWRPVNAASLSDPIQFLCSILKFPAIIHNTDKEKIITVYLPLAHPVYQWVYVPPCKTICAGLAADKVFWITLRFQVLTIWTYCTCNISNHCFEESYTIEVKHCGGYRKWGGAKNKLLTKPDMEIERSC